MKRTLISLVLLGAFTAFCTVEASAVVCVAGVYRAGCVGTRGAAVVHRPVYMPGMHHCSGGPGPYNFDPLTPLTGWVESGVAPDRIIGEVPAGPQAGRTFPLCPFPSLAVFQGGNVDDAANWVCKAHINHRHNPGKSKK